MGEKKKTECPKGTFHCSVGIRLKKLQINCHLKSYQTLTQTETLNNSSLNVIGSSLWCFTAFAVLKFKLSLCISSDFAARCLMFCLFIYFFFLISVVSVLSVLGYTGSKRLPQDY